MAERIRKWVIHHPVFECDRYHPAVYRWSPWAGLRNFAYDYLCFRRPHLVVELGTHYGCSAFAFQQAIMDNGLPTRFIAVDTWAGDDFTRRDYSKDVHAAYCRVKDLCYAGVNARRMRMTFDEANVHFADGRIDLLHIDGSHRYEDVKRDFKLWRPKIRKNGVIFFHDTGEDLYEGAPMGSHIFWKEMTETYPWTITLPFSNGLGIYCADRRTYRELRKAIPVREYQRQVNLADTENKAALRELSYLNREQEKYIKSLEEDHRELEAYSAGLEKRIRELENSLKNLELSGFSH